ncbi:hypothetical protein NDU88_006503 [Pleurodeles waltl]|uniref:Uncharacterized protein n=1 Tax=Pleurodeles waltl TaxID=8319 RepID=A0AAV7PLL2_PLEWA|nr:hypothetical protein NDU88_006503 [Pleurodeles waltl]
MHDALGHVAKKAADMAMSSSMCVVDRVLSTAQLAETLLFETRCGRIHGRFFISWCTGKETIAVNDEERGNQETLIKTGVSAVSDKERGEKSAVGDKERREKSPASDKERRGKATVIKRRENAAFSDKQMKKKPPVRGMGWLW